MREFAVPAMVDVDPSSNTTDLVLQNAIRTPHAVAFRRKVAGRWQDVTCREFLSEVTELAKGFIAAGVQPGDRIGLMSKTRYEWTLTDFAIWFAGAVTVPIYETSAAEQVAWILSDSGPSPPSWRQMPTQPSCPPSGSSCRRSATSGRWTAER